MFTIIPFRKEQQEFYDLSLEIRKRVFVEEQGVDQELEIDAHEGHATFYLIYQDQQAIGTARWRVTEHGIKLERFAILPQYRNLGVGAVLLKRVLEDVKKSGKTIYLHSQERAVPFYQREGFVCKGDAFTEAGIVHYKMIYPL
jgi:predicted GNAT family N-acyltransferase